MRHYVVTVTADGATAMFGPFPSPNRARAFAHRVRRARRGDGPIPAVAVEPVHPGRLAAVRL